MINEHFRKYSGLDKSKVLRQCRHDATKPMMQMHAFSLSSQKDAELKTNCRLCVGGLDSGRFGDLLACFCEDQEFDCQSPDSKESVHCSELSARECASPKMSDYSFKAKITNTL